ncbi:hypothetical protein HPB49_004952 [Dermacentor silvarum]|uniref:Uncharacterized protein n=1 Tax=Dermacentor silvarum TaxID=543639 RepID=A0ACB8DV19_DERSI|nr:hypothetical protein HPB49_004952 [Dermacentor silvarum]
MRVVIARRIFFRLRNHKDETSTSYGLEMTLGENLVPEQALQDQAAPARSPGADVHQQRYVPHSEGEGSRPRRPAPVPTWRTRPEASHAATLSALAGAAGSLETRLPSVLDLAVRAPKRE